MAKWAQEPTTASIKIKNSAHYTLQSNQCIAPAANQTVLETAPTCRCVCQ